MSERGGARGWRARLTRGRWRRLDRAAGDAARTVRQSEGARRARVGIKEPFYPAPNRTHLAQATKSLRQGRAKGRPQGSANAEPWDTVDMIPTHLDEEMTDLHAKVRSYEDRLADMSKEVDVLRGDVDEYRAREDQLIAAANLDSEVEREVYRRELGRRRQMGDPYWDRLPWPLPPPHYGAMAPPPMPPMPPMPPGPVPMAMPPGYPHHPAYIGCGAGPVEAQLHAAAAANEELRASLARLELDAGQREALHRQIAESEALCKSLRETVYARDADIARLEQSVAHTAELQRSFEELKGHMAATKHRLEAEVKSKHLEVIQKDEELRQLRGRQQLVVDSANTARAASTEEVRRVKEGAAADLAVTQAAVHDIHGAAERQREKNRELKAKCKAAQQEAHGQAAAAALAATKLEDAKEQLGQALAQRDAAKNAQAVSDRHAEESRTRAAEVQARFDQCEGQAKEAHQTILRMTEEATATAEKLRQAQVSVDDHRRHLDASRAKAAELEGAVARLQGELETSRRRGAEAEGRVEAAEQAMAEHKRLSTEVEMRARTQIEDLENELRKAVQLTENLEQLRADQTRVHESKIWDLKEQLDFANTAKRSLQNYASYVRSAYGEVFDSARV